MTGPSDTLLARIDRMESMQAIQQLPIRYALAVDGRDLDAWVGLFVEDVNCGRHGSGRVALRAVIEPELRTFYRSIHQICGHRVEFDDADCAHGTVYCRAEHEVGGEWIVMAIAYFDDYARRDGEWYFDRLRVADNSSMSGSTFHRWPVYGSQARLPGDFPCWPGFWAESTDEELVRLIGDQVRGTS